MILKLKKFNILAAISTVCIIIIAIFLANRPAECQWIGEKEQKYLTTKLEQEHKVNVR